MQKNQIEFNLILFLYHHNKIIRPAVRRSISINFLLRLTAGRMIVYKVFYART